MGVMLTHVFCAITMKQSYKNGRLLVSYLAQVWGAVSLYYYSYYHDVK